MSEDRKRRTWLDPEIGEIDTADAEVDVIQLTSDELGLPGAVAPPSGPPAKKKWEEAKTTFWSGREGEEAGAEEDARPRPTPAAAALIVRPFDEDADEEDASAGPAAPKAKGRPGAGGARPRPQKPAPAALQLEAPSRLIVRSVEQISPDPRLCVMTQPGTRAAEQYRVLSLKLREGRAPRSLLVTAPGKEVHAGVVAANLALALGEGKRARVAIVETDLRRPELLELFGLDAATGLAEQIRSHRRSPEDSWSLLGLTSSVALLPAGPPEENPASLLSSESVLDLFEELYRRYDHVVLTCPPAIESADMNILQDYADAAILAVLAGATRKDSVKTAVSRFAKGKLAGTVLVGAGR